MKFKQNVIWLHPMVFAEHQYLQSSVMQLKSVLVSRKCNHSIIHVHVQKAQYES